MLELYLPGFEELWFRQKMLADEETMSYNHAWGGTVAFEREDWQSWYDHWTGDTAGMRYYRYLKNEDGDFVGEIAYHYDGELSSFMADVIIYAPFRGRGYGRTGLEMLCGAAAENEITVLRDDMASDNPALSMFLKCGFTEEYRTQEKIMLVKDLRHHDAASRPRTGQG